MAWFIVGTYALFAIVAATNLIFMPCPLKSGTPIEALEGTDFIVLIPCRDEEVNLRRLLPTLADCERVVVFDDESADETAETASQLGATVIRPPGTLPAGWTGKNWACFQLAQFALRDSEAEWLLFLDADVRPGPRFAAGFRELAANASPATGVITGFPEIVSGRWPEPLFLGWVGWILLAANPFGLVSLAGKGHNRFTNGQFHAWRRGTYERLQPNESVRGAILEDVKMGRLCARRSVPVVVANVSSILAVKMYETWREALDGMSKNSHEITDSALGTVALSVLLSAIGWGWAFSGSLWPVCLGLLWLSAAFCAGVVRAKRLSFVLLPVALSIGSFTLLRSLVWRRRRKVTWKGRTYG